MLLNKIHYADNRAVNRRARLARRRRRSRPTLLHDDHQVAFASVYRIQREHLHAARAAVGIYGLDEHNARRAVALIFLCGNDVAEYAG